MDLPRSAALCVLAAAGEIGGARPVRQEVREDRGVFWVGPGMMSLGLYGFVATVQPDPRRP